MKIKSPLSLACAWALSLGATLAWAQAPAKAKATPAPKATPAAKAKSTATPAPAAAAPAPVGNVAASPTPAPIAAATPSSAVTRPKSSSGGGSGEGFLVRSSDDEHLMGLNFDGHLLLDPGFFLSSYSAFGYGVGTTVVFDARIAPAIPRGVLTVGGHAGLGFKQTNYSFGSYKWHRNDLIFPFGGNVRYFMRSWRDGFYGGVLLSSSYVRYTEKNDSGTWWVENSGSHFSLLSANPHVGWRFDLSPMVLDTGVMVSWGAFEALTLYVGLGLPL